jgi:hypothetical protein
MSVEDLERRVRLLCTDELGVVRVAEAAGRSKIDDLAFAKRWGDADRSRRVVRCRAGEDGDGAGDALGGQGTCAAAGWLALGRNDGTAEVIDTATGGDVGGGALDIGGVPVGVQVFGPGAGREGARLVTVTDAGEAAVYDAACDAARDDGSLASRLAPLRVVQEWSPAAKWKACDAALVARASPRARLLAVGGKGQGNDLKIYDVETQKVWYKAKPPPENWLGYRAPPYVSAMEFVPGNDGKCVLVGTGERRVRLYDARADKRAVMDLEVGETTVTALALNNQGTFAFVGNAKGQLQTVDLRERKVFAKFKGVQGSVRSIAPHPEGEPLVAVAGLDRYLRVYHTETRKCLGSAFMKQALSGCAWDVRGPETEFAAAAAEAAARRRREKAEKRERKAAVSVSTDLEKKADARLVKAKGKKPKRASAGAEDGVPAKKKKKKKVSVD